MIDSLSENVPKFRHHVQASQGNWLNIGYVRKSPSNESEETRIRLLKSMMLRIRNRCFVSKIFVSYCSSSTTPLLERDYSTAKKKQLGDGNCQGKLYLITSLMDNNFL